MDEIRLYGRPIPYDASLEYGLVAEHLDNETPEYVFTDFVPITIAVTSNFLSTSKFIQDISDSVIHSDKLSEAKPGNSKIPPERREQALRNTEALVKEIVAELSN